MGIVEFIEKLKSNPRQIEFTETMAVIEQNYQFWPTAFTNGELHNEVGQNSGSCKLLAFASIQNLTKEETLACFGKFYFDEVLGDTQGATHQNIRNFIKTGFDGLQFKEEPLKKKWTAPN